MIPLHVHTSKLVAGFTAHTTTDSTQLPRDIKSGPVLGLGTRQRQLSALRILHYIVLHFSSSYLLRLLTTCTLSLSKDIGFLPEICFISLCMCLFYGHNMGTCTAYRSVK